MRKLKIRRLIQKAYNYNSLMILIIGFAFLFFIYFFCQRFFEPKAYDFFVKITAKPSTTNEIVNIAIDETTLSKVGRWPWKRPVYTDIFEYLENDGHAKAIAFDSIIASYGNPKDDREFFSRLSKLDKVAIGLYLNKNKDTEHYLYDKLLEDKFSINVIDKRNPKTIKKGSYKSSTHLPKEVILSANTIASVTFNPDSDDIIRKMEPIFYYKDKYIPSLAFATILKAYDLKDITITNKKITANAPNLTVNIPIDSSAGINTNIMWYKPQKDDLSHKTIPAWKIIQSIEALRKGKKPIINPTIFKDKIIVIGVTAPAQNDFKATPLANNYPGMDVQTTCIENILTSSFITKTPFIIDLAILITVVAITLWATLFLSTTFCIISIALLLTCLNQLSFWAYSNNYAMDVITPNIFILCFLFIGYVIKYFLESDRKNKIQKAMAKYVSNDVMENIMENIDEIKLGGKKVEVSVLFADIRDFTAFAETLDPQEVTAFLNQYFSLITPIIQKHKGTVNKFIGDAVLAVFGSHVLDKNHAENATLCAIEILEKVKELKEKLLAEGKPKLDIGIGINTGEAIAGNIGSPDRMEYTVIGDTVNVANRIESYNRIYKTKLLISSSTYERVKQLIDFIKINHVSVKGRVEEIDIYEVLGLINNNLEVK